MYSYNNLLDDVNFLSRMGVETGHIGSSAYGRMIPYIHIGGKGKQILIMGGIHARENVSAIMVMRQVFYAAEKKPVGMDGGIYFVPMLNPDGNMLIAEGIKSAPKDYRDFLLNVSGTYNFVDWKANGRAVDLNTNFDARWGQGGANRFSPSPESYVGEAPFSETESRALAEFTKKVLPEMTLSYHAMGREIYWEFYQQGELYNKSKKYAKIISDQTGYKLLAGAQNSAGGYKDWCISALKIPGFTIELGQGNHPLTENDVKKDIDKNIKLPLQLIETLYGQQ